MMAVARGLYRFYRLDFGLRNLGLVVIAVLTLDHAPAVFPTVLAFVQVLLAQMYSFSMNDLYDHQAWGEDNEAGQLVRRGVSLGRVRLLAFAPLLLLIATAPLSGWSITLLFLYEALFHVYQAPGYRYKDHYLSSILLNSICLGTLLYLYPAVYLAGRLTPLAAVLSVLFFCYLAFHEIVHQIAHLGRDRIVALPARHGIPCAIVAAGACLLAAVATAAVGLALAPWRNVFLATTILFSVVRIGVLAKMPRQQEAFLHMRDSWHRFYTIPEGAAYAVLLLLARPWS